MVRWAGVGEPRIGLGCMRLSTDDGRDESLALDTIGAALGAGIRLFDTARAYGHGAHEVGHNERLLARALRAGGAAAGARIVTKGGMTRTGGRWIPDGRAKTLVADCEASLEALGGLPVDLYLIHAPDPRTPWTTSVRALARLEADGLVSHVGLSNVNRRQLDDALELAPVAAVEVSLGPFDDRPLRGGVVERCADLGIAVIAHSPLGGPHRARRLERMPELRAIAEAHDATPAEIVLAWLRDLSPVVIPIPGARRPETAGSAARAASLVLGDGERERLAQTLGGRSAPRRRHRPGDAQVVLVMGIPGAGKTRVAEEYATRDHVRLNRDVRGGSLRELAAALDHELGRGVRRLVLDNTYLTRASRSHVLEAAGRHGAGVECVWLDTPLAQAQVNLVERLLDRFGALPTPEGLREAGTREPGLLAPTSQMRAARELEPPAGDEGFLRVRRLAFERVPVAGRTVPGLFLARAALEGEGLNDAGARARPEAPVLVFDWIPDGGATDLAPVAERLATELGVPVETAICPHGGGPPTCWCRPPLPGLLLAFARAHGVDTARSTLVGVSPAHRTLAATLGARYITP